MGDSVSKQEKGRKEKGNPKPGARKKYRKPTLVDLGDLRSETLAPSPGTFESGRGAGFNEPTSRR